MPSPNHEKRTRVKLCGITRFEDAHLAADAGVDFLGFIQFPISPRYVEPRRAREIIDAVDGPLSVGVFVNESPETVNAICAEADFDVAQLHGNESVDDCSDVNVPVIKAFRVEDDSSPEQLREQIATYRDVTDFILLDTHKANLWGGTGEVFNWQVALELPEEYDLFLAGGIGPNNVVEAIETVRPFAVDLSSSVEISPGIKDPDEMAKFFDLYHTATKAR